MTPRTTETARAQAKTTKAAQILLSRLIDYAGLFPPAALNMLQAVTNYDAYQRSEHSWMLGRFIVPAARLNEFDETLAGLNAGVSKPWSLSVLLGTDVPADLARIVSFNAKGSAAIGSAGGGQECPPHTRVESAEVKANTPDDVKRLAAIIPRELATYFEIPLVGREGDCIAAIAECGCGAKIRTGGETEDKFPDSAQVIDFMKLCANARVPFKATAGLHHPIRSVHRLTYQPDSASTLMHGFLNVFLAAAFLRAGMEPRVAVELLEERSSKAMSFDAEGIMWREHRLTMSEIASARQGFSISFGSCSFTEPIDDLRSLGLL
jgi:hypothetical protein